MVEKKKTNTTLLFVIRGALILFLNIIFYIIILFAAIQVCKVSYSFANEIFGSVMAEAPPGKDVEFKIEKADDAMSISKKLKSYGLISNTYSFYIKFRLSVDDDSIILAGKHNLNTSMTYDEIINSIVRRIN